MMLREPVDFCVRRIVAFQLYREVDDRLDSEEMTTIDFTVPLLDLRVRSESDSATRSTPQLPGPQERKVKKNKASQTEMDAPTYHINKPEAKPRAASQLPEPTYQLLGSPGEEESDAETKAAAAEHRRKQKAAKRKAYRSRKKAQVQLKESTEPEPKQDEENVSTTAKLARQFQQEVASRKGKAKKKTNQSSSKRDGDEAEERQEPQKRAATTPEQVKENEAASEGSLEGEDDEEQAEDASESVELKTRSRSSSTESAFIASEPLQPRISSGLVSEQDLPSFSCEDSDSPLPEPLLRPPIPPAAPKPARPRRTKEELDRIFDMTVLDPPSRHGTERLWLEDIIRRMRSQTSL